LQLRRTLAGVAVGTALILGSLAAPAAQAAPSGAAAVTCGNADWPHQDKDKATGRITKTTSAAVHTGPYGACSVVAYLAPNTAVTYDCYAINDENNTWTWVRDPAGASIGWVYDSYLSGSGSSKLCDK
jgi:SH3-like domain-containing protein